MRSLLCRHNQKPVAGAPSLMQRQFIPCSCFLYLEWIFNTASTTKRALLYFMWWELKRSFETKRSRKCSPPPQDLGSINRTTPNCPKILAAHESSEDHSQFTTPLHTQRRGRPTASENQRSALVNAKGIVWFYF